VQIRHFAGENIARIANRVRAMALSLLQLRVLRLGFLQDGDVGIGVFPESEVSSDKRSDSLLRQTDLAHQLSKPRIGTQGIE
jgi:hypothetical protein